MTTQLVSDMEKPDIIYQLRTYRNLAFTEENPEGIKEEAWRRIDGLLEVLHEVEVVDLMQDVNDVDILPWNK